MLLLRRVLLAGIFAVALPGLASADSDGYYCVGRNYIAYQFGMAAPPLAPHILHVIRFDENGGMLKTIRFRLPQFQVHGCAAATTRSTSRRTNAIHTVTLAPGKPMLRTVVPWLQPNAGPEWARGMLPCTTDIESDILGYGPAGAVIHARPVFRGHGSIECGE